MTLDLKLYEERVNWPSEKYMYATLLLVGIHGFTKFSIGSQ